MITLTIKEGLIPQVTLEFRPDQARHSELGKAAIAAEALVREMVFGKKKDEEPVTEVAVVAAGVAGADGPVGTKGVEDPAGSPVTEDSGNEGGDPGNEGGGDAGASGGDAGADGGGGGD